MWCLILLFFLVAAQGEDVCNEHVVRHIVKQTTIAKPQTMDVTVDLTSYKSIFDKISAADTTLLDIFENVKKPFKEIENYTPYLELVKVTTSSNDYLDTCYNKNSSALEIPTKKAYDRIVKYKTDNSINNLMLPLTYMVGGNLVSASQDSFFDKTSIKQGELLTGYPIMDASKSIVKNSNNATARDSLCQRTIQPWQENQKSHAFYKIFLEKIQNKYSRLKNIIQLFYSYLLRPATLVATGNIFEPIPDLYLRRLLSFLRWLQSARGSPFLLSQLQGLPDILDKIISRLTVKGKTWNFPLVNLKKLQETFPSLQKIGILPQLQFDAEKKVSNQNKMTGKLRLKCWSEADQVTVSKVEPFSITDGSLMERVFVIDMEPTPSIVRQFPIFTGCRLVNGEEICLSMTMGSFISGSSSCAKEILSNIKPKSCPTKIPLKPIFGVRTTCPGKRLILTASEPTDVSVFCNSELIQKITVPKGYHTLNSSCEFRTDDMTLVKQLKPDVQAKKITDFAYTPQDTLSTLWILVCVLSGLVGFAVFILIVVLLRKCCRLRLRCIGGQTPLPSAPQSMMNIPGGVSDEESALNQPQN